MVVIYLRSLLFLKNPSFKKKGYTIYCLNAVILTANIKGQSSKQTHEHKYTCQLQCLFIIPFVHEIESMPLILPLHHCCFLLRKSLKQTNCFLPQTV